jgi:hypothetical protein
LFRAIAKAILETPKMDINNTLAVAIIAPTNTNQTATELPVALMASAKGETDWESLCEPTKPTATKLIDT